MIHFLEKRPEMDVQVVNKLKPPFLHILRVFRGFSVNFYTTFCHDCMLYIIGLKFAVLLKQKLKYTIWQKNSMIPISRPMYSHPKN